MNINSEVLTKLGIDLTTLAVKGTVTAVNSKIATIKLEKDVERVKNKYDEIINELLSEREEAVRIAQIYKTEIERYEISDKDIEHLHNTISKVLELLKKISPDIDLKTYESIQELISVDTLKAMQLLGFNYKAAIGEPLTELCSNAILSNGKIKQKNKH